MLPVHSVGVREDAFVNLPVQPLFPFLLHVYSSLDSMAVHADDAGDASVAVIAAAVVHFLRLTMFLLICSSCSSCARNEPTLSRSFCS